MKRKTQNQHEASAFGLPPAQGLYDPSHEHDACGVGFVAQENGQASHEILKLGLFALGKLSHRGAVDADEQTGDGAGILTQLPTEFFKRELGQFQKAGDFSGDIGVGMIFFPREDTDARERSRVIIEDCLTVFGLPLLGWRWVPFHSKELGAKAMRLCPDVRQILVGRPEHVTQDNFESTLYFVRKEIERRLIAAEIDGCYICSFSHRTIVYKGLMMAAQLRAFYTDLQDPLFVSAFVVFHQRYSTNTFPTWSLAQPFRLLGHNGEINTIQGNRNWARARTMAPVMGGRKNLGMRKEFLQKKDPENLAQKIIPIVQANGSDSASLDNVLEALCVGGERDIVHAMMMLIPEPWQNTETMKPIARDFYEYHGCLNETWDGPAAVVFADGRYVGGIMDRNGLRPMCYKKTRAGLVVVASELGVLEVPDEEVVEKGRIGPGRMILVDTKAGRLLYNAEIKQKYFESQPYGQWLAKNMVFLGGRDAWPVSGPTRSMGATGATPRQPDMLALQEADANPLETLRRLNSLFGYTKEDLEVILKPMVDEGKDPVGSMGDDTPLAILSERPQHLSRFFKQKFAQVTNPPIDSLRESKVMTLNTYLGKRGDWFNEGPEHAHLLRMPTAMIWDSDLEELENHPDPAFRSRRLPAVFPVAYGAEGMELALHHLCRDAARAVEEGVRVLVLSDREVNVDKAPIPMLLAVSAVHHHLIRVGLRLWASLIADTGDVWEIHHLATLIGYGASVVNPYLALHSIKQMCAEGVLGDMDWRLACGRFHFAMDQGMLKIMAKMGISTLSSYRGAQVFDVIGLNSSLIDSYFTGTPSKIGGLGLPGLAADVLTRHERAFSGNGSGEVITLPAGGFYRYRKGEEVHSYDPEMVKLLHEAVVDQSVEAFNKYAEVLAARPPITLKDLLVIRKDNAAASALKLEAVEPMEQIRKRFGTPGMSLGALSRESHESLAIAMNRIGARCNSGEGGEDPERYKPRANGDWANSNVKQVASGRFGVTPAYLCSAQELQIKMAQGSKPGEGGQLPGHKVSAEIARLRYASVGVTLISPPPHHDIYSIEDLAQLIYDLRHVCPKARISVKLVSTYGVGTIAAGVVKADADVVLISGYDGGTGASPWSSIKNAGLPWELGIAEAHQTLVINNLRSRVRLRVDGGFKTGLDVIKGAILGADEFNFGSIALVSQGCVMVRKCHTNQCPTGVATQDEKLRRKFVGTPDRVIRFMNFIADDVRRYLAELGFRRLEDLIGRTEYLKQVEVIDAKYASLDLSPLLYQARPAFAQSSGPRRRRRRESEELHIDMVEQAMPAVKARKKITLDFEIRNQHRTAGASLSGEITRYLSDNKLKPLPDSLITLNFTGSAGQSFGAFCTDGMRLNLSGEANDYVGKGMAGGIIAIRAPKNAGFNPSKSVLVGNTVLYGATGGKLFVAGKAGERFAVRNSGATAVIDGAGHHACEYMTRGIIVILGKVSNNFGAGMSGGIGFVLDEKEILPHEYNPQMVKIERLSLKEDETLLKALVEEHYAATESERAKHVLENWQEILKQFWRVVPKDREIIMSIDKPSGDLSLPEPEKRAAQK